MDNLDKIIDNVIKELEIGVVDSEIKFYMKIHSKNSTHFEITPVLNVNNKDLFYSRIKEYVELFYDDISYKYTEQKTAYIKRMIALLFANMSINDFNDPCQYIKKAIDFKKNPTLQNKDIYLPIFESVLSINVRKYNMETPYCFETNLISDKEQYLLPIISYGISEDTCYIYAIQDFNEHKKTPYHDKTKRMLYKLNKGVMDNESNEYKEYKDGIINYYPENISDVSPSAVLALTIFLNEIEKIGINKVKVIPYLPVRYENKIKVLAVSAIKEAKKKNLSEEEKRKIYLDTIRKQKYNQSNMTEKFIRTFYRVAHHFENVNITSIPMELDDMLHIRVSKFEYSNNEILNEVIESSNNKTL